MNRKAWKQPFLIVAGVPKAGTTSLFAALARHPAIRCCAVKEPGYFLTARAPFVSVVRASRGDSLAQYRDLFQPVAAGQVCLEATAVYLHDEGAAERIAATLPNARVVVALRDPIARLQSFFQMTKMLRAYPQHMTTQDYIAHLLDLRSRPRCDEQPWGLIHGCYAQVLAHWIRVLGRERVHVIYFDELRRDPSSMLAGICRFAGLDPTIYQDFAGINLNPSRRYRALPVLEAYEDLTAIVGSALRRFPAAHAAGARIHRSLHATALRMLSVPSAHEALTDEDAAMLREYFRADTRRLVQLGYAPPWSTRYVEDNTASSGSDELFATLPA